MRDEPLGVSYILSLINRKVGSTSNVYVRHARVVNNYVPTPVRFPTRQPRCSASTLGFSVVDFAHLEEAAHQFREESDDWAAADEPSQERVWKAAPSLIGKRPSKAGGWAGWVVCVCGGVNMPFSGALGPYIRNLMDLSPGQSRPIAFSKKAPGKIDKMYTPTVSLV